MQTHCKRYFACRWNHVKRLWIAPLHPQAWSNCGSTRTVPVGLLHILVDDHFLSERVEGGVDLIEARGMVEIEKTVDLRSILI